MAKDKLIYSSKYRLREDLCVIAIHVILHMLDMGLQITQAQTVNKYGYVCMSI